MRAGAIAACIVLSSYAQARIHRSQSWAEAQFTKAEAQRETLNGRAPQARTRREYEAVIASYRRVVLEAPTSSKAEASAFQAAALTAEMGRHFKDDMALYAAVREYKFLRREYPGSKHRIEALLAIGEIYKNDLGNHDDARAAFAELIRRYPRSELAKEAQAELSALPEEAATGDTMRPLEDGALQSDLRADNSPAQQSEAGQPSSDERTPKAVRVTNLQYWSAPDYTRIAVDLEQDVEFESQRIDHPDRIFFDLKNARLASHLIGQSIDVDDGLVKKVRVAQFKPGQARIVIETDTRAAYNASLLLNPPRLVIDVHGEDADRAAAAPEQASASPADRTANFTVAPSAPKKVIVEADDDDARPEDAEKPRIKAAKAPVQTRSSRTRPMASARTTREAQPTADGDRSLIRALGLKIGKIVVDPGHGGHDTGTIGPNGLLEKNLVLDVSKRLEKLLESRLGADVVLTRRDDTFIPLETRTAIANQEQADLFVSVHANSSRDPDARGVETYYLNFTSSPEALEVAARENAASDKSIHELQDLVKKIALKEKIEESREFAADVQQSLHSGLALKTPGVRDRGVKKAPFVVLIGANMPSILAEISFLSNPGDEKKLRSPEYRQRIAESLYRGISRYVNGLGGVKVASQIEKAPAN
ncbi:MAG TPA: N-acetylmuramoyl-L-alanine amidase [Terriglobales bacterium]|nr:N-acetylmuramoyl-L-alanine amidase [Terriglobales bacterium]